MHDLIAISDTIAAIELESRRVVLRSEVVEQEYHAAVSDLLNGNQFRLNQPHCAGPYALKLAIADNRLVMNIVSDADTQRVLLPIIPLKRVVKDYFIICEQYYTAIRDTHPSKMETIDMARRGIHNEGADILIDLLAPAITVDHPTARRLFTLICVLHIR